MDRYQGQLLIAHFVVGKWKGRQLGLTGQILWCCQGCEEHFLQDVSSKEFIINLFASYIAEKKKNLYLLCSRVVRLLFRECKTSLQLQLVFCLF